MGLDRTPDRPYPMTGGVGVVGTAPSRHRLGVVLSRVTDVTLRANRAGGRRVDRVPSPGTLVLGLPRMGGPSFPPGFP